MTNDSLMIVIRRRAGRYIYEFSPGIEELFRSGVLYRKAFEDRVTLGRSIEFVCGEAEAYVRERTGSDVLVVSAAWE